MGSVFEELTVTNALDIGACRLGFKKDSEVRRISVLFKADTGANPTVITESVAKTLGLTVESGCTVTLGGGVKRNFGSSSPIAVHWKDRTAMMNSAVVVPDGANNLLGAIAMEAMDITPDVTNRRLIGIHGDKIIDIVE